MREFGSVAVDNLHLRAAREKGERIGKVVGYAKKGEEFEVVGPPDDQEQNRWLHVRMLGTGQVAYLAQKRHDGSKIFVHLWAEQDSVPEPWQPPTIVYVAGFLAFAILVLTVIFLVKGEPTP